MPTNEIDLRVSARGQMPRLGDYPRRICPSAVATWQQRMINEHSSATVFEALGRQLADAGFSTELTSACATFAAEERKHGVLCGAVVEALGAAARAPAPPRPPFPRHLDAPPRAAALRNVIHICCMSETIAVALIGAERLEMPAGELRELLTQIWSDEVGHARLGWRLLEQVGGSIGGQERAAIERYLPVAFRHVEEHELAFIPELDAPAGGEALGLCSGRQGRFLMKETIEEVIRPGLRRWFAC
jgi:hypothetical protein